VVCVWGGLGQSRLMCSVEPQLKHDLGCGSFLLAGLVCCRVSSLGGSTGSVCVTTGCWAAGLGWVVG